MSGVVAAVAEGGGIATRSELAARGVSKRALAASLDAGETRRIRRGYYTTRAETDAAVAAVAAGGRLTGMSALRELGCWMWDEPPLHLAVHAHANAAPVAPPGAVVHWEQPPALVGGTCWRVSLSSALRRAALDEEPEAAIAAFDWAMHLGGLSPRRAQALVAALPEPLRRLGDAIDARCESFPESTVRTRLRNLGFRVASQQAVARTRQRIDLVVEGLVAIEVDGREFHEAEFERDRRKDLAITRDGRTALRISAAMVRYCWPEIADAVRTAVDRHRGSSGALRRRIRRSWSESDQGGQILLR